MATQAIDQVPVEEAPAEAAPTKLGNRNLILLAAAGLVLGTTVGLLGLGPILAKRKTAAPPPKVEVAKTPALTHSIDNMVLNPAGSGASRFLMVSAAFELKEAGAEQLMKEREAEIRDRILELLGKKTVEELTEPGQREVIKKQVLDAVVPMFPKGIVLKVFFPQFVIQ